MDSGIVIVVSSCDAYRPCWPPFVHGLEKYWPGRPWPVKFITNCLDAPIGETLKNPHRNWSNRTSIALESMAEEAIILLLMEDYWLTQPVDTQSLKEFAALFANGDIDYIRLRQNGATIAQRPYWGDNRLFVTGDEEMYRAALQAGFWKVDALRELIEPGETAQQFEILGSKRSRGTDRMLCVRESSYIQYVDSAVRLGKWTAAAKEYAAKEKLHIDFSTNPDGTKGSL